MSPVGMNGKKRKGIFIVIILILALSPCPAPAGEIETVLIVSIDALHPDALGEKTSKTIHSVMKKGVFTMKGQSVSPPLTLLSHAAMFSGVGPGKGGRKDNSWKPGWNQIRHKTIFDHAKSSRFSTGFFYSKEKLGFLLSDAVDQHKLDPDFSVENAEAFFKKPGRKKFCFLHVGGLDRTGPTEGWLSKGYMEELFFIDESLSSLVELITSKKGYLLIITSDHAGHGTIHGSDHPDDAKLPLAMVSDIADLERYQGMDYCVTKLKAMLKEILSW
ncbi:conserved exported hypothetical protein [Candidatus Desulfarcum epimagneticum]|uniref:Type I phosphodiesterase / nucleotide pyrophosphatase n=1 Tax=uncultured Desulfobacteraceae bacterium TaxID=218296 RepID=A0A484HNA5_9BACT|nr:conserved exported hypothetical protein [uncultured Desulfobacteraceae bacterium]